jgi:hypothetical protein
MRWLSFYVEFASKFAKLTSKFNEFTSKFEAEAMLLLKEAKHPHADA